MLDHKFVWMLGAGASLASGIPLGSQLVDRWLKELHTREDAGKTPIEEWATDKSLGIDRFKYEDRASFYPKIYERRFKDYPDEGYAYLESVMADADPSPGYSILASALAGGPPERPPRHNAVVTTNFDNLVADALSIYTDTFPFVCGHESLTPFVKVAMRRPLVCKIHRDLLLAPQNDTRSLRRLHDAWGTALRSLFEHYTPLFIGYGGNDDTLMDLLESLQPGDIKGQMIWCYHEGAEPSERIVNVTSDHQGILVPVPDFDLLMVLLGEKMGISLLDEDIGRRAETRTKKYRERIKKLDTVGHPQVAKALAATYDRSGGGWAWEQKAVSEADPERSEVVYRQGIQHCPKHAGLCNNFAIFLTSTRQKHEEAEKYFIKASVLDPNNGIAVGNLGALFLAQGRIDEAANKLAEARTLNEDEPVEQLAAEIEFHTALIATISDTEDINALDSLRNILADGFPRSKWCFQNVLNYARDHVSKTDHEFYTQCADAILNESLVPLALPSLEARIATAREQDEPPRRRRMRTKKATRKHTKRTKDQPVKTSSKKNKKAPKKTS
jgi:protein O-mannosyl-transferase